MTLTIPALLADVTIPGHDFGMHTDSAPGSTAFVVMTLGFLVFLFIGFAIGGYVLWRRQHSPPPHVKLLQELQDEAEVDRLAAGETKEPEGQSWERDPDWWKQ
jgi:hypothetical protein